MSSLPIYPVLPGLTFTVTKTAEFNTLDNKAPSGYDIAIPQAINPIWHWQLIYDFLRDFQLNPVFSATELRQLMGFFTWQSGSAASFLFDDPDDDFVGPGVTSPGTPNVPWAKLSVVNDGAGHYYSPVQRTFDGNFWEDITDLRGIPTGYGNATGSASMFASRPLGNWFEGVQWSNFVIPSTTAPMPADAVIQGIYPVIICSGNHDQAFSYYTYGKDPNLGFTFGSPFTTPSNPASTTFGSTEFYDPNVTGQGIGTSLTLLNGQKIQVLLNTSLLLNGIADSIDVTAVGFCIYYTSATPVIDAQIPPPFTVLAGHGLIWALPMSVAYSGPSNTGTSFGTAAVSITTSIKVYDNGVLQVAGTDYNLLGPGLAIPGFSCVGMYLQWLHHPTGPVTAEFFFWFRVKFEGDSQDFEKFLHQFWTVGGSEAQNGSGTVKLETRRPPGL